LFRIRQVAFSLVTTTTITTTTNGKWHGIENRAPDQKRYLPQIETQNSYQNIFLRIPIGKKK
jgi:hypothetical protein